MLRQRKAELKRDKAAALEALALVGREEGWLREAITRKEVLIVRGAAVDTGAVARAGAPVQGQGLAEAGQNSTAQAGETWAGVWPREAREARATAAKIERVSSRADRDAWKRQECPGCGRRTCPGTCPTACAWDGDPPPLPLEQSPLWAGPTHLADLNALGTPFARPNSSPAARPPWRAGRLDPTALPRPDPRPLTGSNAIGRHVLIPSGLLPERRCSERDGRGWRAFVVRLVGEEARLSFVFARAPSGRPEEDVTLPLEVLEPL